MSFFIKNYRFTYLILVGISIFGIFAILQMPKESAPEVDIPVIVVSTILPGAGSENVEELITKPIENQISGLSDIESMQSISSQGISTIIIQFSASVDSSEMITEIRSRVARVQGSFPLNTRDPVIQKISFSDVPIIKISLSGDYSLVELKKYAKELKEEIESINGVSQVNIIGAPDSQIQIEIDNNKLFRYGLSIEYIIGIIAQSNIDSPIGIIESGGNYAVRFDGQLKTIEDILNIPIIEKSKAIITVGDVATVKDGFSPTGSITRFSIDKSTPEQAVSLNVFKESGEGNILKISDAIQESISLLDISGLNINIIQNDADLIRNDLNNLVQSGLLTILIILIILAFFLGFKEALLASTVVPFSFLISFIVIEYLGLTINFLTLFSLILSLGILVDASIVVVESISRKKTDGQELESAIYSTISEFKNPLITGTLTTVFAFAPMLLVSGIMGEFIKSIPLTVSTVLIASLLVSLGIITTLASRFLRQCSVTKDRMEQLNLRYRNLLSNIIGNNFLMNKILIGVLILFVLSTTLPFVGIIESKMFPLSDSENITINVELPYGTTIEKTNNLVEGIEEYLLKDENVYSFLSTIGQGSGAGSINLTSASKSHQANISVKLKKDRNFTSQEITLKYINDLNNKFPEAEIKVNQLEDLPISDSSIQVNIKGKDLDQIELIAQDFAKILKSIEGVSDVDDGIESSLGEFVLIPKKENLRRYGLTVSDIAQSIRTSVAGRTVTTIQKTDEEVELILFSQTEEDRSLVDNVVPIDISFIKSLPIQTQKGIVMADYFVDIELKPGRISIERQDRDRVISVSGNIFPGYNASNITQEFMNKISELDLPSSISIDYGGEMDQIQESFTELFRSMLLGVLIIFALMVLQFNSYRQSIFIIITIPLALIGVFFGLVLTSQPLSIPGFIGIVALAGIVVNNAIILIDTMNTRYSESKDLSKSIIDGAVSRFRPILLTTLTTVFGLVPLAFVSPIWAPIAYSIIFGLMFSTILTLFIIPILYKKFINF
ncbi:MAG: Swarming motility protein SwrC [Parcubacteria group bacterium ADurb.Bin247]|jgi:HAE1 family hydrophobic/amphiphilic exporter-1|nr:MAG: Swarming motility protein SwrC [Parcubacteria group bacterium ADurb.Bin247]HQB85288.1 efflux RND transporter permease subunit [Candidatus Pacearchaeota archaeon]